MKLPVLFVCLVLMSPSLCAQDDDTIRFVHGLPITGEDSAQQVPQPDVAPYDTVVRLSPAQLPPGLASEFDKNDVLKNWRGSSRIELDPNTGVYWIIFTDLERGRLRSYGFDDKGNPVSIKEKTIRDDVNPKR